MKYDTVQASTEKSLIVIPTARKIATGVKSDKKLLQLWGDRHVRLSGQDLEAAMIKMFQ